MSLVIRCDASTAIGSGHVMRCLTLASALSGQDVTFACAEIGDGLAGRITAAGHRLVRLPGPRGGAHDLQAFMPLVVAARGVIMDGYAFGVEYRRAVRAAGRPVLALDDTGATTLSADIVVNPSPAAPVLPYDGHGRLLLGPEYALVAPHLLRWRNEAVAENAPLLLTFGGSDPLNLTLPVATALRRELADAPLRAVLGGAVADLDNVARGLAELGAQVEVDVADMGPILRGCRLAVSAGGSTLYELAALGRPMVLAVVADNQDAAAQAASAEGWAVNVDARMAGAVDALAVQVIALWPDHAARDRLAMAAAERVDGQGARRVAEAFLSCLD